MKLTYKSPLFMRAWAISLMLALGAALGTFTLPDPIIGHIRSFAHPVWRTLIASTAAFAIAALGLWIHERAADLQRQLDQELLDAFLAHIPDNVFFKDLNSRFVRISTSMAKYCGLDSPAEAYNKTDADIFSGEHAEEALADEQDIIRTGRSIVDKEEKETWPDGHETWVLTTKIPLKTSTGKIMGTMGIAHNITPQKEGELRVRHMAMHDLLTGLPNRTGLNERLAESIASAKRHDANLAILHLDLDRFSYVNDSWGHFTGDRLLENVAARLKGNTRASDIVARIGADEFLVAVPEIANGADVERVAQKILDVIAEPMRCGEQDLRITGSIGISQFPENGESAEALLQCADAALVDAKKRGRGRISFFSPALTEATRRRQQIESDLLNAISHDEFVIHYQPIIDSPSGRITAMEALLRWKHPRHGLISPDQFIPLLEELGLMVDAGRWVLRSACRQAAEWNAEGIPSIRMAINVSAQQLYEGNLVDTIEAVLRETHLNPKQLELELTESRTLDDSEATISILQRLKQVGLSLSVDDFGTGWSSLSCVRQFPLDRIKIDRSFVRDLTTQPTAQAMVRSILGMAQNLGFLCIAEGVESSEQSEFLKKLNCPEMQGFYFSRPLTAVDATALLRSRISVAECQIPTLVKSVSP